MRTPIRGSLETVATDLDSVALNLARIANALERLVDVAEIFARPFTRPINAVFPPRV